jgi:hypothetical protein
LNVQLPHAVLLLLLLLCSHQMSPHLFHSAASSEGMKSASPGRDTTPDAATAQH